MIYMEGIQIEATHSAKPGDFFLTQVGINSNTFDAEVVCLSACKCPIE